QAEPSLVCPRVIGVLDTTHVPVVITGSQRVPHALGSDAYVNLRHVLELAANENARGLGVLQRPRLWNLLPNVQKLPRVDILPTYGGADAALLQAVLDSGPDALVIDGLGRGQVPIAWRPGLLAAHGGWRSRLGGNEKMFYSTVCSIYLW